MLSAIHNLSATWLTIGLAACLIMFGFSAGGQPSKTGQDQPSVALLQEHFHRDLTPSVRYYEDKLKKLSPQQAIGLDFHRDYRAVNTQLVDFGFSRSRYWLRVRVHNPSNTAGVWKLTLDVPVIESAEVYLHAPDGSGAGLRQLLRNTETSPFFQRPVDFRNLVANVPLEAGESGELLIGYSSKQSTKMPLTIEAPNAFHARARTEDIHNWVMFALVFGITIVSTVYLTALGFNTAAFYGAYIFVTGFFLFQTDGYAFQLIWPNWPVWNSYANAPLAMATVTSGSLFARSFTRAWLFHPIMNRLLLASAGISIVGMMGSVIWFELAIFRTIALLFAVFAAGLYLLAGLLAMRRGQVGSLFFVLGALAIVSSIAFGAFSYLSPGQFEQDTIADFVRYALLFEGLAFALAILLHIMDMRRERDEALHNEISATQAKLRVSQALVEAERAHTKAVALAEQRRHRLASAAHDIQQPLASLRLAVSRLNAIDDNTVSQVHDSFDYLDSLVSANIEASKPVRSEDHRIHDRESIHHADHSADSAEAITIQDEEFDVAIVLRNVQAMFQDEAQNKGIDFKFIASTARVRAQPLVLMRIISNLVANAVKYTDTGRVLVGVRRGKADVGIEVHDTGPGISTTDIDRLLLPYERGSTKPGTGLGLTLVRELAAENGIDFDLMSHPGKGTKATIRLAAASGWLGHRNIKG